MEDLSAKVPVYVDKLSNSIYARRMASPLEILILSREKFLSLSLSKQTRVLLNIQQVLSLNFPYEIDFQSINMTALLKASNVRLSDDYPNLPEKLLDYIGIVRELDRKKLFITVNLRSYISDKEAEALCVEFLTRRYDIIMLESTERKRLSSEKRYVVDSSLCEIS